MGGGGTISESISGGHKKLFLTILYNFKNIWGGGGGTPLSLKRDVAPVLPWTPA